VEDTVRRFGQDVLPAARRVLGSEETAA
jgi:hypothetical protein